MEQSRTKKSVLFIIMSGIRQIVSIFVTFISRTIFIYFLGAEYLGLNGLFSNILSILALSELGIGTALSFYLYKPIADGDIKEINKLMRFYNHCYKIVGGTILGLGICIMPFLKYLVNFDQQIDINLYLVYFIYLLNVACTYLLFAYKQAYITANQEQYKIEKINIVFTFLNGAVDIVILMIFRDYIIYLLFKLLLTVANNIAIAQKVDKEYPYLKQKTERRMSKAEIKEFIKKIKEASIFRIGSQLYNATDNVIISTMIGTIIVGYYSNYLMIFSQITLFLNIILKSFIAGVGNVIAKESKDRQYTIFKQLDFLAYFLTAFCSICLFQLTNSFIKVWIGQSEESYLLSQMVVALSCINFYMNSTTDVMNTFREANGRFESGKYLQIIGGTVNIVLSIIFARFWGLEGILFATVLCKGTISLIPFIGTVSKNVFGKKSTELIWIYLYRLVATCMLCLLVWIVCEGIHMGGIKEFILEVVLCGSLTVGGLILIYMRDDAFKGLVARVRRK